MYNDNHIFLRDTVDDYLAEKSGSAALRKRHVLRNEIGEMGWGGLLLEEAYGGSNMDITSACVLAQEIGRYLTLSPVLSSVLIPSFIIQKLGSNAQKMAWLPLIAQGKLFVSTNLGRKENSLQLSDDFKLNGEADFIPDLHAAHALMLSVKVNDEYKICFLPNGIEGLTLETYHTFDHREFGKITLNSVSLEQKNILTTKDMVFSDALGALLYASEQYGCAAAAFDLTIDHLKQRKQFGRIIGSFQALQHRAAVLFADLAMSESLILKASLALENNAPDAEKLCSMAKSKTGRMAASMANEAIQMHGGIGMTDEHDVGLYMKRIAVSEKLFGDHDFHTNRVAQLCRF